MNIPFAIGLSLTCLGLLRAEVVSLTDVDGRTIEAEVVELGESAVKVRLAGRGEFEIPLERLDAASRERLTTLEPAEDQEATAAPEAKPAAGGGAGRTLTFDFPELPVDFKGAPARMKVRLPENYDASRSYPLVIFLPGGNGGNEPNGGGLLPGDFVFAGLPYPDDARNPAQNNMVGDFKPLWKSWKVMLAKLVEEVPNLDPKARVIGGFSNGAHAIDGLLGEKDFADFFHAFVMVDGGGSLGGSYKNLDGKFIYYAWGAKSPNADRAPTVISRAERSRATVVASEMKDTGHSFPGTEKKKVTEWLETVVLPTLR